MYFSDVPTGALAIYSFILVTRLFSNPAHRKDQS
jgi:hypothetical protein